MDEGAKGDKDDASVLPSSRYLEIEGPGRLLRRRAADPRPVLPKAHGVRTWKGTAREREPLVSCLTGSGRAGKPGRLLGSSGSVYEGDVLAGRPHGWGRYYAQGPDAGRGLLLQYEGEFFKGQRHGQGTCQYHAAGEVYTGQWLGGRREGDGRLQYANGDSYEGAWRADRRNGPGRLRAAASGDVFVGTFAADKRQGLGVLYMTRMGKKYVAEYVDDAPVCGTVLDLASDDLEPPAAHGLAEHLAREAARRQLAAAAAPPPRPGGSGSGSGAGTAAGAPRAGAGAATRPAALPVLHLAQPSKVLAREFVALRAAREAATAAAAKARTPAPPAALAVTGVHAGSRATSGSRGGSAAAHATNVRSGGAPSSSGGSGGGGGRGSSSTCTAAGRSGHSGGDGTTLASEQLELLRHAFSLMAGGGGREARLLPKQLPELAVLAGLDPAAPRTVALLDQVRSRAAGSVGGGVALDAVLHAAIHFRGSVPARCGDVECGGGSSGDGGGMERHDMAGSRGDAHHEGRDAEEGGQEDAEAALLAGAAAAAYFGDQGSGKQLQDSNVDLAAAQPEAAAGCGSTSTCNSPGAGPLGASSDGAGDAAAAPQEEQWIEAPGGAEAAPEEAVEPEALVADAEGSLAEAASAGLASTTEAVDTADGAAAARTSLDEEMPAATEPGPMAGAEAEAPSAEADMEVASNNELGEADGMQPVELQQEQEQQQEPTNDAQGVQGAVAVAATAAAVAADQEQALAEAGQGTAAIAEADVPSSTAMEERSAPEEEAQQSVDTATAAAQPALEASSSDGGKAVATDESGTPHAGLVEAADGSVELVAGGVVGDVTYVSAAGSEEHEAAEDSGGPAESAEDA